MDGEITSRKSQGRSKENSCEIETKKVHLQGKMENEKLMRTNPLLRQGEGEFFEIRKKQLAKERLEAIRSKPPTKTQLRNLMITYLKHTGRFTHAQLNSRSFEEIQKLYIREQKWVDAFVPIGSKKDEKRIESRKKRVAVSTSRYVVPTGRVVVPTGRYAVPTGRVVVSTGRVISPGRIPTCRYVVPTGRVVVPTGRIISPGRIPTCRYVVPTGRVVVPTGRIISPGRIPTGRSVVPTSRVVVHTGKVISPGRIPTGRIHYYFLRQTDPEMTDLRSILGSWKDSTLSWSPVCCILNPPVLPLIPPEGVKVSVPIQDNTPIEEIPPVKKKPSDEEKQQNIPWIVEEEIALCKAWLNTSEDSLTWKPRRKDGFWIEILEYLEKNRGI
nr:hypothetical protein [Tanacetum cinerariifolium]